MKLFAIVNKDGVDASRIPAHDEKAAWLMATLSESLKPQYRFCPTDVLIDHLKKDGYRCIELHTYDPSKQVVVDRDVYKHISQYVGDVLEEYGGDGFPFDGQLDAANKFLKAGEIKP